MKVLICGGRDWWMYPTKIRVAAWEWLKTLDITRVVHGGARGADRFGDLLAYERKIPCTVYPADWDKHGKAAGYIRNQQMLDNEPDIEAVIAFPGGKGTADMVARARKKGIKVIEYA